MLQHQSTGQSLEAGSLCLFHPIPSCSLPSWGRDAGITEHAVPAGLGFLGWSSFPGTARACLLPTGSHPGLGHWSHYSGKKYQLCSLCMCNKPALIPQAQMPRCLVCSVGAAPVTMLCRQSSLGWEAQSCDHSNSWPLGMEPQPAWQSRILPSDGKLRHQAHGDKLKQHEYTRRRLWTHFGGPQLPKLGCLAKAQQSPASSSVFHTPDRLRYPRPFTSPW